MIARRNALLVVILLSAAAITAQPRSSYTLDTWRFAQGAHDGAAAWQFDDSQWQQVRVPHDWAISGPFIVDGDGNTGKLPWKGQGWYRTTTTFPQLHTDQRVYLLFDGVMAFPRVFVNGTLAGKWDYGYNSFFVDITPHVRSGRNLIAVHADTRPHDSRWYPGGGLYRKVQVIVTHRVHVPIWGTHITTPIVKPHYADVQIATTVRNTLPTNQTITVRHTITNAAGQEAGQAELACPADALEERRCEATITLPDPRRWDLDDPHLYTVTTDILAGSTVVDRVINRFGVRTMRFTADHGFYLNDRRVQFKGVNLHHDLGPLGAAFNKQARRRQLEIMKDMGCNAIRNSHNTAAPELLELCDEMGLLMFNEIFDKYDGKADITDTTDFEDFAHRNMRNFVMRDRNHPSIFLWSVGNEIGDVQWNIDGGFHKLQTMVNYLRKYDQTRPVTLVCDNLQSAELRHFDYYDVHAWNYGRRYRLARQLEPNKSVIISESASTLSTRGFYEFPLPEEKTAFTRSLQVSSYDLNAPWWAEIADDDFMWQQQEPYIAGEFVWTGFDYLGEPTPYNNQWARENGMTDREASRSSYFGIVDLSGIPKDRYYLYKSYWKPEDTAVHLLPHWNWPDRIGDTVPVFVYTNGDCAELYINGVFHGRKCKQPKSQNSVDRFRLMWRDVIYEPGAIRAVAYHNGDVIGESRVVTAGPPHSLRLTPERTRITANNEDLSFILIEAVDEDGHPCPLAMNEVQLNINGAGSLEAISNGNPQSFRSFKDTAVNLFYGKAMAIVRSAALPGEVAIRASSPGLGSATVRINVQASRE